MKKEKQQFVASVATKHFKMDKQTKRMMALGKFPGTVKLNAKEQAEEDVKLEALTRNDFKKLMIKSQLSDADSSATGMDDPLWKPKKKEEEAAESEGVAGTTPAASRKGKKAPKMRKLVEDVK